MQRSTTRSLRLVAGALLIFVTGCGDPYTPAQKQAIMKLQERGARILFRGNGFEVILNQTSATDADLQYVAQLKHVKALDVSNTQITDDGLKHLEKLDSLEVVTLDNTKVTPEGVERLSKALPKTQVFLERAPNDR